MSHLLFEKKNGVAYLTFNRPEVRNALSIEMRQLLLEALEAVDSDDSVRAVVVKGAGEHFVAGGDVKAFSEFASLSPTERRNVFFSRIHSLNAVIYAIRRIRKPVIASVQGAAAGAGVSLLLACDLVIASENAFFSLAYVHLASSLDGGASYHLPRLVGQKKAMEIALLGERFSSREALELGVINRVVPDDDLDVCTMELAERLAKGPTIAYGNIKQLMQASSENSLEQQLQLEAESFGYGAMSADWVEGVMAFNEKRTPSFRGQ